MKSHSTSNRNNGFTPHHFARMREKRLKYIGLLSSKSGAGFTLFEVLIVLGLFVILAALGLFLSMDLYRGNSLNTEKNMIISILQKARSRAVNNINENQHGVRFESEKYIVFELNDSGNNINLQEFPASDSIKITDPVLPTEIIFDQLTGSKASGADIKIEGQGLERTITINNEGRISW